MKIVKHNSLNVGQELDIVAVRKIVREYTIAIKFGMTGQTKLVTAASELARNILRYAATGTVEINVIQSGTKEGIQMIFEDQGPGIPDIPRVMVGGYTTGGGLGLGLSGSKRLVDEFDLKSVVGEGTCVKIIMWK